MWKLRGECRRVGSSCVTTFQTLCLFSVGQSSENEETVVPHAPFSPSDGGSRRRSSCGSAQSANRRSVVPPPHGSPAGECLHQASVS